MKIFLYFKGMHKRALILLMVVFANLNYALANTQIDNVSSVELRGHCKEIDKGVLGVEFDAQRVEFCKGYFDGFFDSMIVLQKVAGQQFCLPQGLPRMKHTQILDAWVEKNARIAPKTTASVALFSALKTAFPCRKLFNAVKER